ncbi:phage major capsid protein [Catenovulum sediminis]|uniref:phage major capsid protein n=1 Tax=Catenovulum sediminis TaxID=1740262 RepID=UPI001180F7C1|nr:phage major capsid protein [Catenovulum sediminis]
MPVELKDVQLVADEIKHKFEEFKTTNDKRFDAVESEKGKLAGQVETLTTELKSFEKIKIDLEKQLDEIQLKSNRINSGANAKSKDAIEHEKAYTKFMRKGSEDGLAELETKALNLGTDEDGGFAVPEEWNRNILKATENMSVMRGVCSQMTIGTEDYKQLMDIGGTTSGWVGETDARPGTNSPQLKQLSANFGEIYANPAATQKSLDDIYFNVEQWLIDSIQEEFSDKEDEAFTIGDGTNKPKGLLTHTMATEADGVRAWNAFQYRETSTVGQVTADDIVKAPFMLKQRYRGMAKWMGSTDLLANLMVLKDGNDNYLWRPGLEVGESSTLRNREYIENDYMPGVAANANALALGDFSRTMMILDRIGIRMLRDPYTNKPYVQFYTTKRVGNMVRNYNAMKFLRVKAA